MRAAPIDSLDLDLCPRCHLVWLDPGEHERLPAEAEDPPAAAPARRALERSGPGPGILLQPDHPLETATLAEVFGIVAEDRTRPLREWPWLTGGVGAALLVAGATLGLGAKSAAGDWGVVRDLLLAEPWRLVTATLVHDHWLELLAILVILGSVGDDLERALGRRRHALLLLAATLGGNFASGLLAGDARYPSTGATAITGAVLAGWWTGWPALGLGHHPAARTARTVAITLLPIGALVAWAWLVLPAKLSWRALGAKNPFHAPHASLIALFTGMAIGLVLAWVWLRPRLPAAEPES